MVKKLSVAPKKSSHNDYRVNSFYQKSNDLPAPTSTLN